MALALSRIRSQSAPLRGPFERSSGKSLRQRLTGSFKADHLRLYLGGALAVAVLGIGVNALFFQHERRPAALFGSPPPPAASASRAPAPQAPAALPPARPAETAESSSPAPPDPITDLLRGEARVDGEHLILAAQTALAKLGYPVKPDGNDGLATQQALRDFEHAHGLPPSAEITPRLVKQLTAAAHSQGR